MPDDSAVPARPAPSYRFAVPHDPRLAAALDDLDAHFAAEGLRGEIGVACGMVMISAHYPGESPVDWAAAADLGDEILATVAVDVGRRHGLADDWLLMLDQTPPAAKPAESPED